MKLLKAILLFSLLFIWGCVGTDLINEVPVEPEDGYITIATEKQSVQLNETIALKATAYSASDIPVDNVQFTWTSSNESIISIDQKGNVTGISIGQVTITASAEGYKQATTMISAFADPNAIASIDVTPPQAELIAGGTALLIAVAKNGDGNSIPNTVFEWTSSNSQIVSVEANGLATALQPGNAIVYASSGGIRSSDIPITVKGGSKKGDFVKAPGTSYNLSGSAELIEDNGNLLLKFADNFSCSNGPALHVYLSPTQTISAGSVDLGDLKSNQGAQEYNLSSRKADDFTYVIIHCVPFNVSFGYAELK